MLKIELFDSKHNLRTSMIQLLGGNWFDFTNFRPDMVCILGNILVTLNLTDLQSDVKLLLLLKVSIIFNISDVSWTLHSIFKTLEYKHFSSKNDKFSIAAPQQPVIDLAGFPTLWA